MPAHGRYQTITTSLKQTFERPVWEKLPLELSANKGSGLAVG